MYQQTFVDTYSKVADCKLYATKTPITSADLLNDRVLPFFEEHGMDVLRMPTDRGTEYCGKVEQHDYELYLALNQIEHTKKKHVIRKQMVSVNASIKQFLMSFTKSRFVRRFIRRLTNCKKIWMIGSIIITMNGLIKEKCAVGVRR